MYLCSTDSVHLHLSSKGSIKFFHTIQPNDTDLCANEMKRREKKRYTRSKRLFVFFLNIIFRNVDMSLQMNKYELVFWKCATFAYIGHGLFTHSPSLVFQYLRWPIVWPSYCGASVEHENWLHYEFVCVCVSN